MEELIHTNYTVIIPVRLVLIDFFKDMVNEIPRVLQEFVQNSGKLLLPIENGKDFVLSFELLEAKTNFPQLSEFTNILELTDYIFLKIQTHLTYEKIVIHTYKGKKEVAHNFSELEVIELSKQHYADILATGVNDLIIASNIANPGILRTESGFIYIDEMKYKVIPEINNFLYEAITDIKHIGWPKLYNLEMFRVWEWLRAIPSYFDGIGKHPIGRALAAFSYLFSSLNTTEPFSFALWAILGLEALYGDDNIGIQKQLIQRTEAFLGKRMSHQKIISQMYDFRSRFLHGDIDFPMRHIFLEGTQEGDKFIEDSFIPEQLAQVVLVATLQEMAIRNLMELKFEVSFVQSVK